MIDFKFFFTGLPSKMFVRSRTVTTAAYIHLDDFVDTLKQYNLDYVKKIKKTKKKL